MIPELKEATEDVGLGIPGFLSLDILDFTVLCGSLLHQDVRISRQTREQVKLRLASTLVRLHGSFSKEHHLGRIGESLELRKDRFGKPDLAVDDYDELSMSFTHVPGMSWAALCQGAQVGIDAAEYFEFEGTYPFHRAFHADERLYIMAASTESAPDAAALLWSAKEAAVKAAGIGFHLIDPLQVKVGTTFLDGQRASSEVRLEFSVNRKLRGEPNMIPVRSFRCRDGWISVALITLPPATTGRNSICGIM